VKAKPGAGVHSAILEVDDLTTFAVDFEIMNSVIASTDLAGPGFGFTTTGSVQRNAYKSFFVTVPPGTPALQVNLSGFADGSQVRWIANSPYGVPAESTSSLVCYTNRPISGGCNPTARAYANPLPGVWEFEVESRRTSPLLDNPFTLSATLQGVAVSPAVTELASVASGVPTALSWDLANTFGPVTVSGTGGPLGSAVRGRNTIADGAQQVFTVDVPAGAARLTVTIGNPSDPAADLDLFVRRGHHAGRAVRRRRLGGVGHDQQSAGRHLLDHDRRVRRPGGHDRVRLPRRVLRVGARLGRRHDRSGHARPRWARHLAGSVTATGTPAAVASFRGHGRRDRSGRGRRPRLDRHRRRHLTHAPRTTAPGTCRGRVWRRCVGGVSGACAGPCRRPRPAAPSRTRTAVVHEVGPGGTRADELGLLGRPSPRRRAGMISNVSIVRRSISGTSSLNAGTAVRWNSVERVDAGEGAHVHSLAYLGEQRQVLGPQPVDVVERDRPADPGDRASSPISSAF
jgi:hypothetical protein